MISRVLLWRFCALVIVLFLLATLATTAGYKARPWTPRAIESYPAQLVSEGITIAVDPLYSDALAAQVFDKPDIVARGIMPLAVIIFNSNDFAIDVDGKTIELLQEEERIRSIDPLLAVERIYVSKPARQVPIAIPIPLPKITVAKSHAEACQDFKEKFFTLLRHVDPHSTAGGFLFLPITQAANLNKALAVARVYIPNIYRSDNGKSLLFFEIDLKPAVEAATRK
jgi:hypothetical protein